MSSAEELADIISQLFTHCQEKDARHVARYGVSIVESRCIRTLYEHKQLTVNQLAQKMSLTSGRVTRIIDGLVSKKRVVRESDKTDRRIFNLTLTPKGEKLAENLVQDHIQIHEEILSHIPSEYQQSTIELLKTLNDAMQNWLNTE